MRYNVQDEIQLENEYLIVTVSNGRISSVVNKENQLEFQVEQDFLWYNGSAGNNAGKSTHLVDLVKHIDTQASGAYIFRPNGTTPFAVTNSTPTVTFNNGNL